MAKKIQEVEETKEEAIEEIVAEEAVLEATEAVDEIIAEENAKAEEPKTTKAGKKSAKAVKEAEAAEAKAERKAEQAEAGEKTPHIQKPRVKKYSKNMKSMREAVELEKLYTVTDAVALIQKISKAKFDPTLEVHVRLGIDPRQADQQLRASTVLPAGSGKSVTIAVLTGDAKKAAAAKEAGAAHTDSETLLEAIGKGTFDFDVLIATPDMMVSLGRHAKSLGPKGLMPSPKSGTVTADPANAVSEIKKGRLEVKNDATGIIHAALGKLSFSADDLISNVKAVLACIQTNRPTGVKGTYVKSVSLSATMTPGVRIDPTEVTGK